MRFNLKVILLAGLAYWVVQFAIGMLVGGFVHNNLLAELYDQTASFWRPALNEDPPDMAAMMPIWIPVGIIVALVTAFIYDNVRAALGSPPWKNGLKFGVLAFLFGAIFSAANWTVFNLPADIWLWWNVEHLLMYLVAGTVLGIVTAKLAPGG